MKKLLTGHETDRMPAWVFRLMEILFSIYYTFKPARKDLAGFGIRKGYTVADWGCGTGAYIKDASEMTGPEGRVFAVDVHELSINAVERIISRHNLSNVIAVLTDGVKADIPGNSADIVYAIDMFHMVRQPGLMLKEISRICRPEGVLFLEDGHQPRRIARDKVISSGCWKIISEDRRFMKCVPVKE